MYAKPVRSAEHLYRLLFPYSSVPLPQPSLILDNPVQGPVYTALRGKLSNILASLVRFNLRILLNPPPEKLSVSDDAVSDRRRFSGKSARLAGPTHFSKVSTRCSLLAASISLSSHVQHSDMYTLTRFYPWTSSLQVHEMLELSRGQPNAALTIALRRVCMIQRVRMCRQTATLFV